tara:strand:- start:69 stop:968 length:900 start_codon:yes stop_codon:yes gene_type:complete
MSRKFCFQSFIDNDRYVILQDLSFSFYKEFLKVLMDNNPTVVNFFIDDVINKCYVKSNFDFDINKLNVVEKLIIILTIKSYSVASDVKFNITCAESEKTFDCNIGITEIIILLLQAELELRRTIKEGHITADLILPTQFKQYLNNDIIYDCVETIKVKDRIIESVDDDVIGILPASILGQIRTFLSDQNEKLTRSPIITYKSPFTETKKMSEIYISLFDNSILETIKLFFETDLLDLYETEYFLIKQHNFSQDLFENKSPAEMYAYISIIEKYKAKEESVGVPVVAGQIPETGIDNLQE